jgi:hypothetical protein
MRATARIVPKLVATILKNDLIVIVDRKCSDDWMKSALVMSLNGLESVGPDTENSENQCKNDMVYL